MKRAVTIALLAVSVGVNAETDGDVVPGDSIQEVVITGTNHALSVSRLPYLVTTVGHEQLEATGHTQLLSAISGMVPSMFVSQRNTYGFGMSTGGSGCIKIRGVGGQTSNSQVLMMVDGKPQFAGVFSHPVADSYRTEFVERVEVVRGPASVLYGSNAMGGTINVITKTPQDDGSSSVVSLQYGSFNTLQSSVTNMTRINRFSSLVSLSYNRTDGTERNFDFSQGSGYVKIGYDFSDQWNAYADYSLTNFSANDPVFARIANPSSTDVYHQNVTRGEASLSVCNDYERTDGAIRTYFDHGSHKIHDPKEFKMLDNRLGVLAYQNFRPWEYTHLTAGFDFNRYQGEIPISGGVARSDNVGSGDVNLKTMGVKHITEYSPYITASQGLWNNLLVASAGLRMVNSNQFGTQWIPQVGLALNPGHQWTLKTSVGRGYRNPSFKELYLYKVANPDLQPETMTNFELSIHKRLGTMLALELTGFYIKGNDLIQTAFQPQLGYQQNVNTGEFCNHGLEFAASSRLTENFSLRLTYSFLESNLDNLTAAPKHIGALMAEWRPSERLICDVSLFGVSRLYVAEDVRKQDYALLDLMLTYRLLPWMDVSLQGQNITDANYCINKGYTMPGAMINAGVKVKF